MPFQVLFSMLSANACLSPRNSKAILENWKDELNLIWVFY